MPIRSLCKKARNQPLALAVDRPGGLSPPKGPAPSEAVRLALRTLVRRTADALLLCAAMAAALHGLQLDRAQELYQRTQYREALRLLEASREKTAAILERRLQRVREGFRGLEKRVAQGQCATEGALRTEAAKVLHRSGVAKYFTYEVSDGRLHWKEDEEAVAARKRDAGKYGLVTTTDLEVTEVLGAYRSLLAAEDAFRVLKDDLDLRPLWHQSDAHIEGHVQVAMWGYLVHKSVEAYLERAGVDLSVAQALAAVKDVQAVEVAAREQVLWRMTQVSREAERVIQAVGIDNLKGQFEQWADGAPAYVYEPRRWGSADAAPVGGPG